MIGLRNKALSRYKKTKTAIAWTEYKDLRNFVCTAVRNETKAYLRHKFGIDPKGFWRTINRLNINNSTPSFNNTFDPEKLNKHFIESIPTCNLTNKTFISDTYGTTRHSNFKEEFRFKEVNDEVVDKIILNIKTNAKGSDGIDLKMLSLITPFLTGYITYILNKCLKFSTYPRAWKNANITPVPKVKEPKDFSQVRPISILPVMSKILERIVHNQLSEFVIINKILPSTQSGFRPQHSTTTALLQVCDDIYRACDQGKSAVLVLLDYSKAFDTLDPWTLCTKLKYFGLSDFAVNFFHNYLSGRQQRVCNASGCSGFLPVDAGVPQGSILGPLLFSLYTSDFNIYLKTGQTHQYADDLQIYHTFYSTNLPQAISDINNDLEIVYRISMAHSLLLNESKSKLLIFGKSSQQLGALDNCNIKINNVLLPSSNSCKNLGLLIDNKLRFENHVSELVQRSYYKLKVFYILKNTLTTEIKLKLCDSLILSMLSYCDVVYWPALTMREKNTLQKLQNACLKFCYDSRKYDHVTPLYQTSNWLKLDQRYFVHMATLVHKINLTGNPEYLSQKLVRGNSIHNRHTRHCQRLSVPKHRTQQFKRSFTYNAAVIYNSLQPDVKSQTSVTGFKRSVKKFLTI